MSLSRYPYVSYNPNHSLSLYLLRSNIKFTHRYDGYGCSFQEDQELFAILHSSREIPQPHKKETGMVLAPIRMKPEHPSTALPTSSRIHFGRAYGIGHNMPVKSLGLIHAESMPNLISAAETHVYRHGFKSSNARALANREFGFIEEVEESDENVMPEGMRLVKEMRASIRSVLGSDLSIGKHPPPDEPLVGLPNFRSDFIDNESPRERKRARIS